MLLAATMVDDLDDVLLHRRCSCGKHTSRQRLVVALVVVVWFVWLVRPSKGRIQGPVKPPCTMTTGGDVTASSREKFERTSSFIFAR